VKLVENGNGSQRSKKSFAGKIAETPTRECAYLFWPHRDHLMWPHLASSIGEVRR
jgi:hypothetical protein